MNPGPEKKQTAEEKKFIKRAIALEKFMKDLTPLDLTNFKMVIGFGAKFVDEMPEGVYKKHALTALEVIKRKEQHDNATKCKPNR